MKYLLAAMCALAMTLASPVSHAQPKGSGGVKVGTTGTKTSVPPVNVRDHRTPYLESKRKAGVLVYTPCHRHPCRHTH